MPAELTDKQKQDIIEFYNNLDPCRGSKGTLVDVYRKIGPIYDYIIRLVQLPIHEIAARLAELFGNKDLAEKRVFDIGAGTGTSGEALYRVGFRHIDALDLSKEMLDYAKEKNVYTNFYNEPMSQTPTPGISDNTYDAAISCGCFVAGHIPMTALYEIIRVVKPGGYIIYSLYDPGHTMNYMQVHGEVMKNNLVELIAMSLVPYKREYRNNFEFVKGYLVVLKVLPPQVTATGSI